MGLAKETVIIQRNIRKKDLQWFATKLTGKTSDSRNAREHYESFLRKKHKIGKMI